MLTLAPGAEAKDTDRGKHIRRVQLMSEACRRLDYVAIHNEDPRPFIWTKSADEILAHLARFCQRTLDSAH